MQARNSFVLVLCTLYLVLFLSSCENDIRTIKLLNSPDKLPVETAKDVELLYSDSAKVKVRMKAPVLLRYQGAVNYLELPSGVTLLFYNDSSLVKSKLTANYAKRFIDDGKMVARSNVVVINEKGDKLETEELTWDEAQQKILIDPSVNVRITTADDTLLGKGLVSNQDFTKYKILKPKGNYTFSDSTETK